MTKMAKSFTAEPQIVPGSKSAAEYHRYAHGSPATLRNTWVVAVCALCVAVMRPTPGSAANAILRGRRRVVGEVGLEPTKA
jgi:hypothetical protein